MVQRSVAGGFSVMRLVSGSTTASSRTTSGAPHSPGPSIGGSDGAIATSGIKRMRQAEGAGGSGDGSCGIGIACTGRGRGKGTASAAATMHGAAHPAASAIMAQMRFT